jgi:Cu/Zn superoxide dismutase
MSCVGSDEANIDRLSTVHETVNDFQTQPAGENRGRIACGFDR